MVEEGYIGCSVVVAPRILKYYSKESAWETRLFEEIELKRGKINVVKSD